MTSAFVYLKPQTTTYGLLTEFGGIVEDVDGYSFPFEYFIHLPKGHGRTRNHNTGELSEYGEDLSPISLNKAVRNFVKILKNIKADNIFIVGHNAFGFTAPLLLKAMLGAGIYQNQVYFYFKYDFCLYIY